MEDDGTFVTGDFILLFISSFFFMLGLYLLLPVLALYMNDPGIAGVGVTEVGFLVGLLTLSSAVLRPVVGPLSDHTGRKPFLLVGPAVLCVSSLLFIPAKTTATLIPVLLLGGLAVAAFHTASLAYIGDIAPRNRRGQAQAWFQATFNGAIMISPPIAIWIRDSFGYNQLFVTAAAAGAVSFVITAFLREERAHPCPGDKGRARQEGVTSLGGLLVFISFAIFASTLSLGTLQAFLGLFAEEEALPNFAFFFTITGATVIILRFLFGGMIDTIGRKLFGALSLLLLGVALVVLSLTHSFTVLCISALIWGTGFAFAPPTFSAMLMDKAPHGSLGKAFGAYTAAFESGSVFGSMVMGPLVLLLGYRWSFFFVGSLCLAAALLFTVLFERNYMEVEADGTASTEA